MQKYEKKIIFGILCASENGKDLESVIDNSVVTCGEIIDAVAKSYGKQTKLYQ